MFAGAAGPGVGALENQVRAGAESLLSAVLFLDRRGAEPHLQILAKRT